LPGPAILHPFKTKQYLSFGCQALLFCIHSKLSIVFYK
jgi:hypothetical protein